MAISGSKGNTFPCHWIANDVEIPVKKEGNSVKKKQEWNCSDGETDRNERVCIKRKKGKLKENGVVALKLLVGT